MGHVCATNVNFFQHISRERENWALLKLLGTLLFLEWADVATIWIMGMHYECTDTSRYDEFKVRYISVTFRSCLCVSFHVHFRVCKVNAAAQHMAMKNCTQHGHKFVKIPYHLSPSPKIQFQVENWQYQNVNIPIRKCGIDDSFSFRTSSVSTLIFQCQLSVYF